MEICFIGDRAAYCNDECFEKTKQFMKEHGIILI